VRNSIAFYRCYSVHTAVTIQTSTSINDVLYYAANYALPDSSGYVVDGTGVVDSYTQPTTWDFNCSADTFNTTRLYATFDVSILDVATPLPRIYKTIDVNPCIYGNGSQIYTIPFYTIIVSLSQGKVSYITFDDGCYFCASNGAECISTAVDLNTSTAVPTSELLGCREPASYCYPASSNGANESTSSNTTVLPLSPCDLKVFVVWTGTDAAGTYLTSAGRRLSRFRQYASASAYQSGLNAVADATSLAYTVANSATSIPGRVVPNRELRAGHFPDLEEEPEVPKVADYRPVQAFPRSMDAKELEVVSLHDM
jgi:hypothetical protein